MNGSHSGSFGAGLVVTGGLVLVLARSIQSQVASVNQDPGPRAFPIGLALFLVAGGLYELGSWFYERRNKLEQSPAIAPAPSPANAWLRDEGNQNALLLLLALAVYLPAIPLAGFSLSTILFSTAMMRRLGASWRLAAGMSFALVILIHLLFVTLFRVQLPLGRLGMPW